jgi:hypothetical protein
LTIPESDIHVVFDCRYLSWRSLLQPRLACRRM